MQINFVEFEVCLPEIYSYSAEKFNTTKAYYSTPTNANSSLLARCKIIAGYLKLKKN